MGVYVVGDDLEASGIVHAGEVAAWDGDDVGLGIVVTPDLGK